ncbi:MULTISPECIES: DUF4347 domain-containing protein [unclassified Microcoleus]|uniref:DUF4347 domain-containing protein n=1 Tax=unclassified Microcoleus TaxID=2642155 RepID=UPI002FD3D513
MPNFLQRLHQFTGAKIAANPHPTGNAALGGTWKLTASIPPSPSQPKLPFTETALKTYSGILSFAPKVDFVIGIAPPSSTATSSTAMEKSATSTAMENLT